jgi:hypothetical protein
VTRIGAGTRLRKKGFHPGTAVADRRESRCGSAVGKPPLRDFHLYVKTGGD